jgi:two-component system sensor histidine kinase ComP
VLIFPLTFAYLIAAKKLYDIDIVVRRMAFTSIVAVLPSALIVTSIIVLFEGDVTFLQAGFAFIVTLVVMSFVLYSLEYFYTNLERVMFPRKYMLQAALKKIAKNFGSITSFRELKTIILVDIVNTLQVFGGAIAFKYKDATEIISEGEIDEAEVERIVAVDTTGEHPEYMCFEINRHDEYTSYLVMANKKTNTKLGMEEIQWLNLIITYLAVSLENVHLIRKLTLRLEQLAANLPDEQAARELNWFRKLMFQLQEKERVRIATDLHDTTMQDLFFLKRKLAALGESNDLTPETRQQIQSLTGYIEVINTNLRQSCFDLHPYLLQETGLIRTIQKVIERESFLCPFTIEFRADPPAAIERRDIDTKRHIFRIVQELINNAKKHSNAKTVRISLTAADGLVRLNYEDDGVGFDPNRTPPDEIGASGIGLEQMKSRVLHLNGRMELNTGAGRGVKIRITLPLKEEKTA